MMLSVLEIHAIYLFLWTKGMRSKCQLLMIEEVTRDLAFVYNHIEIVRRGILTFISVCYSSGPAEGCTVSPIWFNDSDKFLHQNQRWVLSLCQDGRGSSSHTLPRWKEIEWQSSWNSCKEACSGAACNGIRNCLWCTSSKTRRYNLRINSGILNISS